MWRPRDIFSAGRHVHFQHRDISQEYRRSRYKFLMWTQIKMLLTRSVTASMETEDTSLTTNKKHYYMAWYVAFLFCCWQWEKKVMWQLVKIFFLKNIIGFIAISFFINFSLIYQQNLLICEINVSHGIMWILPSFLLIFYSFRKFFCSECSPLALSANKLNWMIFMNVRYYWCWNVCLTFMNHVNVTQK